ncbi:hypothetical protein [Coleofasciculus sp. F4-SAH-05]|uniref:hypothetical protein n=1 Tax=Coleofasciculus sp. F4-SAH-05 TaxID=3069525 RepID=UPI00330542B7
MAAISNTTRSKIKQYQVSITAFAEAERQKEHYESAAKGGQAKPSFEEMITTILKARRCDDLEEKQVRADLKLDMIKVSLCWILWLLDFDRRQNRIILIVET